MNAVDIGTALMKPIHMLVLFPLAAAELCAGVDPPASSTPAVEVRVTLTQTETPMESPPTPRNGTTGPLLMEVDNGELAEMLKFLEDAAKAGNIFTVKLIIDLLEYWGGRNVSPVQIPSRLRGELYYRTEQDCEWFAKLEELLTTLDIQDLIRQAQEMQKQVYATYQRAFSQAAFNGHPVVMDLILALPYRMPCFTCDGFLVLIARSSVASDHNKQNAFVGVIKRVLSNGLFTGGQKTIGAAIKAAENEFVLRELTPYLKR